MQLFLFKVALRLMAMKRGSLKVIFLGVMVGLYPWIFKNTFDVDTCLPNNKIFIHLPFKSKFWNSSHIMYDRFVKWFHELLLIESTNFFNEISFVMYVCLGGRIFKIYKKCRYTNTFFKAVPEAFRRKRRLAAFQILEKRTRRVAVLVFFIP